MHKLLHARKLFRFRPEFPRQAKYSLYSTYQLNVMNVMFIDVEHVLEVGTYKFS